MHCISVYCNDTTQHIYLLNLNSRNIRERCEIYSYSFDFLVISFGDLEAGKCLLVTDSYIKLINN